MAKLGQSRWRRRITTAAQLLFCWVVVPLVLVEIAMIVLEPHLFKGFYQYDQDIGFRVRAQPGRTNALGFNDRDYPLQRQAGVFRILVIGDSFAWAGGMHGNYTALLEGKLNEAARVEHVEVINASLPMSHTGDQVALLKKYGLQFEPHLVVVGFFAGNDFLDADPRRKRIVVNDTYLDIRRSREVTLFGYPIVRQSRLLAFVKQKYRIFREGPRYDTSEQAEESSAAQGTFSEETFLSLERDRLEFCNLRSHAEGKYAANIGYIFESLRAMRDLLSARGVPLLVAIFPDEFQVDDRLADAVFSHFKLDRSDYDLTLMQKVLRDFLQSENIPHVDMLERFRQVARQERLYRLRDSHWNQAGNRLAAAILQESLTPAIEAHSATGATNGR
jgi:hypothetical protein